MLSLQLRQCQMALAKMISEKAELCSRVRFYEEENSRLISENAEVDMWRSRALASEAKLEADAALRAEVENLKFLVAERDRQLAEKDCQISERDNKLTDLERKCKDYEDVISATNYRTFNSNSDATRMLGGEILLDSVDVSNMGFEQTINAVYNECIKSSAKKSPKVNEPCTRRRERTTQQNEDKSSRSICAHRRNVFSARLLAEMGIDASNIPEGGELIRRKDKESGLDIWYLRQLHYQKPQVFMTLHKIGRFNIPCSDPMNSKRPDAIIEKNPFMPSIATFIITMKYVYHMSENRIMKMLRSMDAHIPQSSLNKWIHQILTLLRSNLAPLMEKVLRESSYTQNDETRLDVRSWDESLKRYKYNTEYIHMALSLEKGLAVMTYKEGSRAASVQCEAFFKNSNIKYFTADRAGLYNKIEKDMVEFNIIRSACWFHARHYLVDAWRVDKSVGPIINLINTLFFIERESKSRGYSHEQRLAFRKKHSIPLVDEIMKQLKRMRQEENKYGSLVKKAINYILNDEQAYRVFLLDGRVEFSNNAAERVFRHIAMGRRNWLHTGSHDGAKNIAFIFSLIESCNLNEINFEEYLEDILSRIMRGDTDYMSMLPCYYKPNPKPLIMPEMEAVAKAHPDLAIRLAIA